MRYPYMKILTLAVQFWLTCNKSEDDETDEYYFISTTLIEEDINQN